MDSIIHHRWDRHTGHSTANTGNYLCYYSLAKAKHNHTHWLDLLEHFLEYLYIINRVVVLIK